MRENAAPSVHRGGVACFAGPLLLERKGADRVTDLERAKLHVRTRTTIVTITTSVVIGVTVLLAMSGNPLAAFAGFFVSAIIAAIIFGIIETMLQQRDPTAFVLLNQAEEEIPAESKREDLRKKDPSASPSLRKP